MRRVLRLVHCTLGEINSPHARAGAEAMDFRSIWLATKGLFGVLIRSAPDRQDSLVSGIYTLVRALH